MNPNSNLRIHSSILAQSESSASSLLLAPHMLRDLERCLASISYFHRTIQIYELCYVDNTIVALRLDS